MTALHLSDKELIELRDFMHQHLTGDYGSQYVGMREIYKVMNACELIDIDPKMELAWQNFVDSLFE